MTKMISRRVALLATALIAAPALAQSAYPEHNLRIIGDVSASFSSVQQAARGSSDHKDFPEALRFSS